MNTRVGAILGSAVLALAAVSTAQDVPASERLTISDKGDVYELTVPVSGVVVTAASKCAGSVRL